MARPTDFNVLQGNLRSSAPPSAPIPPPVEPGRRNRRSPPALPMPDERRDWVLSIEQSSGWIASLLLHLMLLFILTLIVRVKPTADRLILVVSPAVHELTDVEEPQDFVVFEQPEYEFQVEPIEEVVEIESLSQDTQQMRLVDTDHAFEISTLVDQMNPTVVAPDPVSLIRLPAMSRNLLGHDGEGSVPGSAGAGDAVHSELGRRAQRRLKFATPDMNYAIDRGLIWLATHQLADGGWSFAHHIGECRGRCPNPGSKQGARIAATGLALLPFLGAGHSPRHGEYRETVSAGIRYLISNTSADGCLWRSEGRMYGHGIATLALCECYGIMKQTPPNAVENVSLTMPGSAYREMRNKANQRVGQWEAADIKRLEQAAVAAVKFIVNAQAADGGWRYRPGELGDTSVVGWQVMALKSAKDAGLTVDAQTIDAAAGFLNSVQLDLVGDSSGPLGTRYAYMPSRRSVTPATTAIGHACRICMGASPYHPAIKTAVDRMVMGGHRGGDMYYNFYANQVVFQHGGAEWAQWSQSLQKDLIASQRRRGHLEGSWHFGAADMGGMAGGRLYATAMSCLCLEETFRHLPSFRLNAEMQFVQRLRDLDQERQGIETLQQKATSLPRVEP